jgi:hypothetical protein
MATQEQWQLSGHASEVFERYLVPAIFAPWAAVLTERVAQTMLAEQTCGRIVAQLDPSEP